MQSVQEEPLTAIDLYRLTLFKWRYVLESKGFDQHEVRMLMFLAWRYLKGMVPA